MQCQFLKIWPRENRLVDQLVNLNPNFTCLRREFIKVKVDQVQIYNDKWSFVRFRLPEEKVLGNGVGENIKISQKGVQTVQCTPISKVDQMGNFDVILDSSKFDFEKDSFEVGQGSRQFMYLGWGNFLNQKIQNKGIESILMLGEGMGVIDFFQLIDTISGYKKDSTHLKLISQQPTPTSNPLHPELTSLTDRINYELFLNDTSHTLHREINQEVLKDYLRATPSELILISAAQQTQGNLIREMEVFIGVH